MQMSVGNWPKMGKLIKCIDENFERLNAREEQSFQRLCNLLQDDSSYFTRTIFPGCLSYSVLGMQLFSLEEFTYSELLSKLFMNVHDHMKVYKLAITPENIPTSFFEIWSEMVSDESDSDSDGTPGNLANN